MSQVAVITGASQGIGAALADYFASQDYNIALLARNKSQLQTVQEQLINNYSVNVTIHPTDVGDQTAVNDSIQAILEHHQHIDVLFNNAGVAHKGTSELETEKFEQMVQVNLLGAFYVLQAVTTHMKQRGSGYIFNLISRSGVIARPTVGGYAATKFGLKGYSEALYKELAPLGIKVTALHPGWVETPMTRDVNVPANEKIQTDDIANMVDALLRLNTFTHISDIVIEPRQAIGLT